MEQSSARTVALAPIDAASDTPPYEQLRNQIAAGIASGDLERGMRLPTVRAAAEELGLAPGTVAKTYKILEADALIVGRGRQGTFIDGPSAAADPGERREVERLAAEVAAAGRRAGITRAETLALVERAWAAR